MTIIYEDVRKILSTDIDWERFSGATILISGAAGFLSSYLVRTLLALNDDDRLEKSLRIVAAVRNMERARVRLGQFESRSDITFIEQDVIEPLKVDGPVNFIVHAASPATPLLYLVDPVNTIEANVLGTRSLLSLAIEKRAERFMLFSSSEIYGDLPPDQIPTRENQSGYIDPTMVRSVYGESKRLSETMVAAWTHKYGLHSTIVRPFHTYGPGVLANDGRVFSDFLENIVNNQNLIIKSDGTARRAFCYVADATEGFLRVLLGGATGTAYNIGNPDQEYSISQLANTLVEEFSERNLKVVYENRSSNSSYSASPVSRICPEITRAQSLGWSPTTGVAEGFRRTVTSIEEE